ncbi:MAG: ribosomal protein S18-alanine N-acetyltransferase [Fidelibacterota bacterium]
MELDVEIRKMTFRDIRSILDIERNSFPEPWSPYHFYFEVSNPSVSRAYVAVHKMIVVGYVIAWFVEHEVHICNLAVHKAYRRMGIGNQLLEFILKRGREEGSTRATLEVRSKNMEAQALYKKHGFYQVGTRKGYYMKGDKDALIFQKDLHPARESKYF